MTSRTMTTIKMIIAINNKHWNQVKQIVMR